MQSENYKFTIVNADTVDFDVRKQMSEIFSEGFSQWLVFFSKDKNKIAKAFAHMFVLNQFYVAIANNNKIAGMTACTDGADRSVRLNKKELRKHLGLFKGSMAGLFLKKEFEAPFEEFPPNTGSIEFVGTASEFRGQGVASQIIKHIIENTPYIDYVIEEVADTNTSAMNLYNKLGFEEYKRKPLPEIRAKKIGINNFLSLKYVKK
ncbi:GNAT family N-acetyltransferase [Lederbergia wuyishanensis]|uniref:Ribosomal protein S18 acetylase RimI-like enzyme n=1 Tax=Lederbergia wuyishanensis TaxID=1347903 RepID=A0ABU0D2L2_9BACI|nr:N-acetyltransferase [Lederbergia wuyishanensis]MCJ8007207.1 GNAT family N-acetyltransferase [Lederbergia wuyishanensis]MDQ0342647.1 ribosomal protein S18 acetylase RimI-like enzyme [Lederbergia wuyishanensis]